MAGSIKLISPSPTPTPTNTKFTSISPPLRTQLRASTLFPNSNTTRIKRSACRKLTTYVSPPTASDSLTSSPSTSIATQHHWMVIMEKPPQQLQSKPDIINYFVKTLASVLGSEKEAQACIYDASWQTHFGFCCDIHQEARRALSRLPEVLLIRPDQNFDSLEKDYSGSNLHLGNLFGSSGGSSRLFSEENSKYWIVQMDKPSIEIVSKPQMVDYYAQVLTKVLGNEKDAQMCIYHISWQSNLGFCCELDEECALELAGVPGVLSVKPDENFGSDYKNYRGDASSEISVEEEAPAIKTKRLFVTGLSFYTSEKTLRAAFEGFGELVEVKIIMDKISKRSKGYAFIEYTTEEAAATALKEMNGKIINGWMIVVDVAKTNPPKYSRGSPRPRY